MTPISYSTSKKNHLLKKILLIFLCGWNQFYRNNPHKLCPLLSNYLNKFANSCKFCTLKKIYSKSLIWLKRKQFIIFQSSLRKLAKIKIFIPYFRKNLNFFHRSKNGSLKINRNKLFFIS